MKLIDATGHGKERLLEETYQLLTKNSPYECDKIFSDHSYQQNLIYYEQANASKSI